MENNNTNLQNQDPYSNKSPARKVVDFILGYFGFFAAILILFYVMFFAISAYPAISLFSSLIMIVGVIAIVIAANSTIKRKYIAKGINFALLTLILIPVLFFGACLVTLGGLGR